MHHPSVPSKPVVIWRFSDGKRGHDNQSLGLIDALARLVAIDARTFDIPKFGTTLTSFILRRFAPAQDHPAPALIVGAGHRTHLPMLAARRARGGRAVVLMKPSLPPSLFDLCIVPRHDGMAEDESVLVTEGALNRVRPSLSLDPARALILLGGKSPHYRWNGEAVLRQIRTLVTELPELRWQIADSRRTPRRMIEALSALGLPNVEYAHHTSIPPDWLNAQLAQSATVWVSEDSVSMVYEALTAGAAVGLIELPATGTGRVQAGIAGLERARRVTRFTDRRQGKATVAAAEPLCEADRCARWIHQRWLSGSAAERS